MTAAFCSRLDRDVVVVAGPDATSFLQSLVSQDVDVIDRDRYGNGWLYQVEGSPDPETRDAAGYARVLDEIIDRMRGRTK